MLSRQSKIDNRQLIDPLAILRSEDGQFVIHKLRFANRANHVCPGRAPPFLRHLLAGVTAPALDVSTAGENPAMDLAEIVFVQPRLRGAVEVAAVIKHETGSV